MVKIRTMDIFVEKNPSTSIEYYFPGDTNINTHAFILWFQNHKNNICISTGADESIYEEMRTSWPKKIFNPMREKMYKVLR